ncbi:hypothetical protein CROQUDRAFT_133756 [Cronartium quercuum f. sp. fusiforme G11]|uniref:J domain-containing protein n=1 Tax=Cronartium quercuum f. sp. fusiforme G11 TaxID=708437 RepID=A0A9P6TB86_9BASI|nr:hypothetical protein CROQUDRAFT_133756 [Cronartium quercuum f. sp. fusiforme G11]
MLHSTHPWRISSTKHRSLPSHLSFCLNPVPGSSVSACWKCSIVTSSRIRRKIPGFDYGSLRSFSNSSSYYQIDHYATLGLKRTASPKQIKLKFYQLSKEHHPDLNPQDAGSAELFKNFAHAYSILSDPVARADHDLTLSRLRRPQTQTYDPQFDPYANPVSQHTNATRRAQAHYAWNARRPPQSRPSPNSHPIPSQPNLSQIDRHEFEATMARFSRLADRRTQSHSQQSKSISKFDTNHTSSNHHQLRPPITKLEPKPQTVKQAFRLAVLLTMMCWLGTKFGPT